MSEYLSTDPNFGLDDGYLSTDPNFGLEKPKKRSISSDVYEVGRQVGAGAVVDLPKIAGQSIQAFTPKGSTISEYGKEMAKNAEARAPGWEPDLAGRGEVAEAFIKGGRSVAPSVAPLLLYAAGPVAGTIGTAALYGGSQYTEEYDKMKAAGASDEDARNAGLITGGIQGGGEAIANRLTLGLFGAGKKVAAEGIKGLVGQTVDKSVIKPFSKATGAALIGEPATEIAQDIGTAAVERQYGLPTQGYGNIAYDSGTTALAMTALLAPFGLAGHYKNSKRAEAIDKTLSDPGVGQMQRVGVVNGLYSEAKKLNIPDADAWHTGAMEDIANGLPVRRTSAPNIAAGFSPEEVDAFQAEQAANQERMQRDLDIQRGIDFAHAGNDILPVEDVTLNPVDEPALYDVGYGEDLNAQAHPSEIARQQFINNLEPPSYLEWAQSVDLADLIDSMPMKTSGQALTIQGILNGPFSTPVKEQAAARLWSLGQEARIPTPESLPANAGPLAKAAAAGTTTGAVQLNNWGMAVTASVAGEPIQAGEKSNFSNTLKGLQNAKGQRAITQQLPESSQGGRDNQAGSGSVVSGRMGQPGQPSTAAPERSERQAIPMGDTAHADVQRVETQVTPLPASAPAPVTQQVDMAHGDMSSSKASSEAKRLTQETGIDHVAVNKEWIDADGVTNSTWRAEPKQVEQNPSGMSLEDAKAYVEQANIDRPLGLSYDEIERMQGGRITDKPKTGDHIAAQPKPLAQTQGQAQGTEGKTEGVAKQQKPRMAESADDLHAELKKAAAGIVHEGKILYPAINAVGMGGVFRMNIDGTFEKFSNGGMGVRKATRQEIEDLEDSIEKDQVQVELRSHWGGSGNDIGTKSVKVLHSPTGLSFTPLRKTAQEPVQVTQPASTKNDEVSAFDQRYPNIKAAEKAIKARGLKDVSVFKDGAGFRIGAKTKHSVNEYAADKAEAEAKKARIDAEVASRQQASAENFTLGQSAEDALAGQGDIFGQETKPDRYEIGRSLTKEQRRKAISTLVDVYKLKNAEKEERIDARGESYFAYPYQPDYFEKSDITGAMLRYYVTLPDGKIAHPSELFPDFTEADIDKEMARQRDEERAADNATKARRDTLERRMAESIHEANVLFWKSQVGTGIKPEETALLTNGTKYARTLKDNAENDVEVLGDGWKPATSTETPVGQRKATTSTLAQKAPDSSETPSDQLAAKSITRNGDNIVVIGYPREALENARTKLHANAIIDKKGQAVFRAGTDYTALQEALNPGSAYIPDAKSLKAEDFPMYVSGGKFSNARAHNFAKKFGAKSFDNKPEAESYAEALTRGEGGNWKAKKHLGKWRAAKEGVQDAQGQTKAQVPQAQAEQSQGVHGNKKQSTVMGEGKAQVVPAVPASDREKASDKPESDTSRFSRRPSFFSPLAKAIQTAKQDTMPAPQWRLWLNGNKAKLGLKDEELQFSGINEYLELRGKDKVTKAEIADYLSGSGVKVVSVVKAEDMPISEVREKYIAAMKRQGESQSDAESMFENMQAFSADYRADYDEALKDRGFYLVTQDGTLTGNEIHNANSGSGAGDTKFSDYWDSSYKGGITGTYREILVTLPVNGPRSFEDLLADRGFTEDDFDALPSGQRAYITDEIRAIRDKEQRDSGFKSGHWDEPNVLVHVRLDEVMGADGKRYVRVGEVQSDWGQKGKKEGFSTERKVVIYRKSDDTKMFTVDSVAAGEKLLSDLGQKKDEYRFSAETVATQDPYKAKSTAPTAPFVTDTKAWVALGIKRAIMHAVDVGAEGVVFGTGQQNADLYDLSKRISRIVLDDNSSGSGVVPPRMDGEFKAGTIYAYDLDGKQVIDKYVRSQDELADVIGKESAEKLIAAPASVNRGVNQTRRKEISGIDLVVGGAGMRAFYDSIVPSVANEVLRKVGIGGKVVSIETEGGKQPGFAITQEAREKLTEQGLPLFARTNDATQSVPYTDTKASPEDKAAIDKLNSTLQRYFGNDKHGLVPFSGRDTDVSRAFSDEIRSLFKTRVIVVQPKSGSGLFNGFQISGLDAIFVDGTSDAGFIQIAGHELWHHIETTRPDLAKWYGEQAKLYIKDLPAYRNRLNSLLQQGEEAYTDAGAESELLADFLGDSLSDPDFLQRLASSNESKFKRLITTVRMWLGNLAYKMRGLKSSRHIGDVRALQTYLVKVLDAYAAGKNIGGIATPNFQRVWHGTPHIWAPEPGFPHGRPRLDKMGTGEGAQAFGWGWYSAESQGVAGTYTSFGNWNHRAVGATPATLFDGAPISFNAMGNVVGDYSRGLKQFLARVASKGDIDLALAEVETTLAEMEAAGTFPSIQDDLREEAREAKKNRSRITASGATGNLYQLEIPDEILPYLLDWDRPLSEQTPEVRKALTKSGIIDLDKNIGPSVSGEVRDLGWTKNVGTLRGEELYKRIVEGNFGQDSEVTSAARKRSEKAASEYLASIGIVGNRYLDGQSRTDGAGTYNFVVWDQPTLDRIALLERNGEKLDAMRDADVRMSRIGDTMPMPDIRFSRSGQSSGRTQADPIWSAEPISKMDTFLYELQDKHIDTKRIIQAIQKQGKQISDEWNVYIKEALYHGRTAKKTEDFLTDEVKPAIELMAKHGISQEDMDEYLHARHAIERNRVMKERNPDREDNDGLSGMTDEDAKAILAKAKPGFKEAAKVIDSIIAKTRQELVGYGLEKQETVDSWAELYSNYVPLQREGFEDRPGTGMGFSVRGNSSKEATGSHRAVENILAHVAMQREKAIVRGEKNRVATALYGLAQQFPNSAFWKLDKPAQMTQINPDTGQVEVVAGDLADYKVPRVKYIGKDGTVKERIDQNYKGRNNVMTVRINGVDHAIIFNDQDARAMRMVESLKNLDADQLGEIVGGIGKVTRYIASMATQYNPVFGVINLIRDTQAAALNLSSTELKGKQGQVMKASMVALKGIYQDARAVRDGKHPSSPYAKLWEEFQATGGQTGYRDMFRTSNDRAEAIEKMLDPEWWQKGKFGKAITLNGILAKPEQLLFDKVGRKAFNWLSDYNLAMENAMRLGAYKVARDNGMSKDKSAFLAKNLTVNFNKKGKAATQAGALYAFFNASAQGTARIAETLHAGAKDGEFLGKTGKAIVYGGITLGAMNAIALIMAGFDDDEPPEFMRERNLIIPAPGTDKGYVSIPMPLGFHVLPNIGRVLVESAVYGKPMDRMTDLLMTMLESFNPIGTGASLAQTISPTVFDPVIAMAENKDWTGKNIYREDFNKTNPTPGFTRTKDSASALSKGIAEAINTITGGTEFQPGRFSPTPDQIDYLIGQVTGGVGREITKVMASADSAVTGEELPMYKVPIAGRLVGTSSDNAAVRDRFYDNVRMLNMHEAEIKGRREKQEPTLDYIREHPETRYIRMATATETQVRNLQKRKRQMIEDGKRESVKLIDAQIAARMKRLNDMVSNAKT